MRFMSGLVRAGVEKFAPVARPLSSGGRFTSWEPIKRDSTGRNKRVARRTLLVRPCRLVAGRGALNPALQGGAAESGVQVVDKYQLKKLARPML
jgi:hypothetical protein